MRLILFLDSAGGMLFNGRRQSQDRYAREYILSMTRGARLWMNGYSQRQFKTTESISLSESPQRDAKKGDYVLIESLPPELDGASEVILFLWNERYPADVYFDRTRLGGEGFALAKTEDVAGYSHEKITVEYYRR